MVTLDVYGHMFPDSDDRTRAVSMPTSVSY